MAYNLDKYSTDVSNILPGGQAGASLAVGDLVYMDSSGYWQKADAVALTDTTRKDALGVVPFAKSQYEFFNPVKVAEVSGYTGLTIGAKQYLSGTAGAVTESEPTTTVRQVVGFAKSATTIRFEVGGAAGGGNAGDVGGDVNVDSLTSISTITCGTNFSTTNGTATIDVANANALAVGANGATNPVLKVDSSTSSVATGLSVTGAAAAAGVAVAAISSGTNENLTIDAKGSGTITLNGTGTGTVSVGADLTMADAKNIAVNTSTGTKIGTATGQKIGFWNATPVVQQSHIADPAASASDPDALTSAALTENSGAVGGTNDGDLPALVDPNGDAGATVIAGIRECAVAINEVVADITSIRTQLVAAIDDIQANNAAIDSINALCATLGLTAAS